MKARIPVAITNRQISAIRQAAEKEISKQETDQMRRWFKLMCLALHGGFGFGRVRLMRAISQVDKLATESKSDEIFWEHADKALRQIGMDFPEEEK